MYVQGIANSQYFNKTRTQAANKPGRSTKLSEKARDSFNIESPLPDSRENRAELLSKIKSNVKKGFYSSDAVLDDLSGSFASVFNKIL